MSLKKLTELCKASIDVRINVHKCMYHSVTGEILELESDQRDEIDSEVLKKMIDLDTIVMVQFYPETPIGSYSIYHYDIDLAIQQAIDIIEDYRDDLK